MVSGLTDGARFFRRCDALALAALPIQDGLLAAAQEHHDGAMVALVPSDPESLAVEHDEALPADDLHITLCFLGKAADLSTFDQTRILSETRRVCDSVGHAFSASADGVIVMGKNDEGVPATALLVQSDDIVSLYDALSEALDYKSDYPSFVPHMTIGYGVPVETASERLGGPIWFYEVVVKFGDAKHVIPLPSAITAARGTSAPNVIDRVIDSLGRLWDEALHPRDADGKFIKKNGAISGKLAVPTRDRQSVTMVDANRASVVGFHTFGEDVWVLAEITNPDGTKQQGFAKATSVKSVAPVKARLDALYPTGVNDGPDAPLERNRQLDLILARINAEYGADNDSAGAQEFVNSLGLREDDLTYIWNGDDPEFLGGLRRVDRNMSEDERLEQEDIINDAKQVKELRDRVHGLEENSEPNDRVKKEMEVVRAEYPDADESSIRMQAESNVSNNEDGAHHTVGYKLGDHPSEKDIKQSAHIIYNTIMNVWSAYMSDLEDSDSDEYADQMESGTADDEFLAAVIGSIKSDVERGDLSINFPPEVLIAVFDDPDRKFRSQFETNTSGGSYNTEMRRNTEAVWGPPYNWDDKNRPIYGHIQRPQEPVGLASHYGSVQAILKKDVRDRTTMTVGDSLGAGGYAIPVNDVDDVDQNSFLAAVTGRSVDAYAISNIPEEGDEDPFRDFDYIEAQIHGGVSVNDIDTIVFHGDMAGIVQAIESNQQIDDMMVDNSHRTITGELISMQEWLDNIRKVLEDMKKLGIKIAYDEFDSEY